ncbi:site-specific tyrosine recombinase XerC [Streptomyces sp. IB2014 011-1]|nr:site-specific tyrosine recombinase XerC [Streptomyces sp. IB2014 011-1]
MPGWRTYWVPKTRVVTDRIPTLAGWEDLAEREERFGIHPGDPILLSPDYRVDGVLSLYLCRSSFSRLEHESKRNYTGDYCVFFDFLWGRGKNWNEATADDLWDFEDWRTRSPRNPRKVGGARWNRGLAALSRLYGWAVDRGYVVVNPVETRSVIGRNGEAVLVPAARAKHARASNVRWLTPRAFRLWVDVGLRGHTADGRPDSGWVGRLEDRNAAYAGLLLSSGMRLTEAASLLLFEVPRTGLEGGRYYGGRLARAVTKTKKARTFYASAVALGDVDGYVESTRADAVHRAQARGRYERLAEWRLVTHQSGRLRRVLHWRDQDGVAGQTPLGEATVAERMTYFTEGPQGPEPLWLWLNESGLPFRPASWENVFRTASQRCEKVLADVMAEPPFATPHMARHSFALYMLVVLNYLMDQRMGLTAEERRDFRLLYGDPWRMVQDLLGHADLETTRRIYLAPVADLRLRSLLAEPGGDLSGVTGLSQERMTSVFARIARESDGIQDLDERMEVA